MKLKSYLKFKKIAQIKLSRAIGISQSKLNLFLNSWIELEEFELKKIADYLKVSVKQITENKIKED
jgi:predicted XRE-type DNA-binding protein